MKIGNFSNHFNVPITTIRYYIDNGILLPMKKNSQYIFTDIDIKEMEIILKLKFLTFSTEEIKHFLQIVRTYNLDDDRVNQHIIDEYKKKRNDLEKTEQKIKKAIRLINKEIITLSRKHMDASSEDGISYVNLNMIACPKCNKPLDMNRIKITQGKIRSGLMNCSCGYNASIEEGIIQVNSDVSFYKTPEFKVQHYGADKDQKDFVFFEHMKRMSEETTALNLKAYTWIDSIIKNQDMRGKVIFIPDLASHYLYKYINSDYFRDSLIVVSGFTMDTIKSIKSHIDQMQDNLNIIYIANTIYDLPLKKGLFDLWIDATSSYNFSFFHKRMLHELVSKYFKENSLVVGLTKYLNPNSQSIKFIHENYSKCNEDNSKMAPFIDMLGKNGWDLQEKIRIGGVRNPGEYYEYIINGEEQNFLCYRAVKTSK